ncbi:MAG: hypothetical protein E7050_03255 [Lentisphaerae bacterium]|nr:hypothetical protein [Lentisphaerota bacterium]
MRSAIRGKFPPDSPSHRDKSTVQLSRNLQYFSTPPLSSAKCISQKELLSKLKKCTELFKQKLFSP